MSPPMIPGWFTEVPSWRGRDGTRIPESGMAVLTSRSELVSESVSSAAMDGAGLAGDLTGMTDTRPITTTGTTPGATRFTTATIITVEEASAAMLRPSAADLAATAEEDVLASAKRAGLPPETSAGAVRVSTVPAQPPDLSKETNRLLEDTLHPAARAASTPAPSAATIMAERQGAIPHAEAPALAVEAAVGPADPMAADPAAVAGTGNRRFIKFYTKCEF